MTLEQSFNFEPQKRQQRVEDLDAVDIDNVRIEVKVESEESEDNPMTVTIWTNAEGVVLAQWQVQMSSGASWQASEMPWPARSGLNGNVLQSMLQASPSRGQEVQLPLHAYPIALRWQLLCLGPPMRWLPGPAGQMREQRLDSVMSQRSRNLEDGGEDCITSLRRRLSSLDSESSDQESRGGHYAVKLRLGADDTRRTTLPASTLQGLWAAAKTAFRGNSAIELGSDAMVAVGDAAGFTMQLDSDDAVALFLASAAASMLGDPTIELRFGEASEARLLRAS